MATIKILMRLTPFCPVTEMQAKHPVASVIFSISKKQQSACLLEFDHKPLFCMSRNMFFLKKLKRIIFFQSIREKNSHFLS
ncbi:MAG: hypothetical protein AVO38_01235 [delta proteobacterium ML8_D]|nr:MAG: hypothetical protein AVO38_01235 [delta proteobacterium ML8_D]